MPKCFVPGCGEPCSPGGPRFAHLLCQKHRAQIPAGVLVGMLVLETQIDMLAERLSAVRETVWEMEPELLLEHVSQAQDARIFADVRFGDELLMAAVAREIPEA